MTALKGTIEMPTERRTLRQFLATWLIYLSARWVIAAVTESCLSVHGHKDDKPSEWRLP